MSEFSSMTNNEIPSPNLRHPDIIVRINNISFVIRKLRVPGRKKYTHKSEIFETILNSVYTTEQLNDQLFIQHNASDIKKLFEDNKSKLTDLETTFKIG